MKLEEEVVEVDQVAVPEVGSVPAENLVAVIEAVLQALLLLGLILARKRKQIQIPVHLIQNNNTPILLSKGM